MTTSANKEEGGGQSGRGENNVRSAGVVRVSAEDVTRELRVTTADRAGTLADFLARHGLALNTRCGGRGLCNGCLVQIKHEPPAGAGVDVAIGKLQRACQIAMAEMEQQPVVGILYVTIPQRSLLRQQPSVVDDFSINIPMGCDPIEKGVRHGAAVDVGTTTVALVVCDLENGKILARASAFNAQIKFGEDVLTRIQMCCTDGENAVRKLQRAVAGDSIQALLDEACAKADIKREDVGVVVVAGNTTMQHLLAGENPAPLGVHPFTPVFLETRKYSAQKLGLKFGKNNKAAHGDKGGSVHLLPGLSGYVGADLTAGLIATGMIYEDGPSLLVDVGTNGEIIAKVGDRIVGCATAAGPAFEGASLTCGTRAVRGAIERVRMSTAPFGVHLDVIGQHEQKSGAEEVGIEKQLRNEKAVGMCGSAYIDFLWEARRAGLLLPSGRLVARENLPPGAHVEADEFGRKFRICEHGISGALWVSELDIVKLLQAKAAIGAGIQTLLAVLGIGPRDVKRLYLAGGFGMHLSLGHAIGCGLLPGFRPEQVQVVGNTSLAGAYLALNDRSLLEEMEGARRRFEAVELNLQPGFEDHYIDNLSLE